MSQAAIGYVDYSGEQSRTKFDFAQLTSGTYNATLTAVTAIYTAMDALSLGNRSFHEEIAIVAHLNPALPTDANAQRERKWLVQYKDNTTGRVYSFTIPCAAVVLGGDDMLLPGTDKADFSRSQWTGLKSAFEAIAVSPAGNAVTVLGATLVGRSI